MTIVQDWSNNELENDNFKKLLVDSHFVICPIADLSQRVDGVKEENLKLKSENQVLSQYIENLMSASAIFQSTHNKKK